MNKKETIIKELEKEIIQNIDKIGKIPNYMIPKINESNDLAYPYVEIGDEGIIYIVIRERGVEYERDFCKDIDDTIHKLFVKIAFELAMQEEKTNPNYSLHSLKSKQEEILKLINPNWSI